MIYRMLLNLTKQGQPKQDQQCPCMVSSLSKCGMYVLRHLWFTNTSGHGLVEVLGTMATGMPCHVMVIVFHIYSNLVCTFDIKFRFLMFQTLTTGHMVNDIPGESKTLTFMFWWEFSVRAGYVMAWNMVIENPKPFMWDNKHSHGVFASVIWYNFTTDHY
jgi:hypothetical protein